MSRIHRIFSIKRLRPRLLLLTLAVSLPIFIGGCGKNPPGPESPTLAAEYPTDAPEETVDEPYLPLDDGIPLSAAELAAFNSTGILDAKLTAAEKRQVELHFKLYVHTSRRTMERFLLRSEPYLPYVVHVLKSRGLPEEIAYLAFVESGFNPNAVSRAGAGGMWQFMPFTGKKYGLAQDRWIDERRDPFKATEAAASYLLALHDMFDDWLLAVAAYNAGEGKIGRALKGTQATSFFEICDKNHLLDEKAQLRDETQQYVPRLLAFTKIMRNLEQLGFQRPDPRKALSFATVDMPAGVDLQDFCRSLGINWARFTSLNPAYRRFISPPHRASRAYVPLDKEKEALAWLARPEASLYAGWKDYKVRRGESINSISKRHGISVALLRQINGKKSNSLKTGEFILVPGSSRIAKATLAKLPPSKANLAGSGTNEYGKGEKHIIAGGDTLFELASRWGTSLDAVCEVNGIDPAATLRVGQAVYRPVLKKRNTSAVAAAEPARAVSLVSEARASQSRASQSAPRPKQSARRASGTGTVVVRQGDTLYSLARAHDLSVANLRAFNNLGASTTLRVGQVLRLTPPSVSVADAGNGPVSDAGGAKVTRVKRGDTLYSLARAHNTTVNVLAKLNGISAKAVLRPGQKLRLP